MKTCEDLLERSIEVEKRSTHYLHYTTTPLQDCQEFSIVSIMMKCKQLILIEFREKNLYDYDALRSHTESKGKGQRENKKCKSLYHCSCRGRAVGGGLGLWPNPAPQPDFHTPHMMIVELRKIQSSSSCSSIHQQHTSGVEVEGRGLPLWLDL